MGESSVQVLVLRAAGTNCDRELAHAFALAGAEAEVLHLHALMANPALLEAKHILAIPGGFSYGDDIASGKIFANQLLHHLREPLRRWIADEKPILGICNGFQVLIKAGLLPGPMPQLDATDIRPATLTHNADGMFIDRWVRLKTLSKKCVWLPPGKTLRLPIAHAEGRFVTRDRKVMDALMENDQIAMVYADANGNAALDSPDNPNGSQGAVAGICDYSGRILGLMPHPERACDPLTDPLYWRSEAQAGVQGGGLELFRNAIDHVRARQAVAING